MRELRSDPGSGARTWLLRIEPGATTLWQSSSVVREGFLFAGQYQDSECFNGESQTWHYSPGGYFLRPPEVWSGGPEALASTESRWLLVCHGCRISAGPPVSRDWCGTFIAR